MTVRLKWPLELAGGSFATVEQDSDEDINQCIKAILMHRPGDRADIVQMGVRDLTFNTQPLELGDVQEILLRHEPRVDVLLMQDPDSVERLVAEVTAEWTRRGAADG